MTSYAGIDYSMGSANFDVNTGIHYGVISQNNVAWWIDSIEIVPNCGDCPHQNKDVENDDEEDHCMNCEIDYHGEIDNEEYSAFDDESGDIFIVRSKYYTYAQFCSPCAPGACYLGSPLDEPNDGNKCYCFGPDMFDEDEPCPYTVYSVETNEVVYQPKQSNE